MEKVDLDYLRKQWKDELGYYWGRAQKEIDEYFEMIKGTFCYNVKDLKNKSREQILKEFSLNENRLKDPVFIPEILDLLNYIKKINYDKFPDNWVSGDYDNKEHASYIWHSLIPKFEPVAGKVLDFKVSQYNILYEKPVLPTSEKLFIIKQFEKYGLKQYNHHIDLINSIAHHDKFYVMLPILLRTLFENILHDIFKKSLNNKHKLLYFDKNKRRVADFSVLIELLNQLSQYEYKDAVRSKINLKIIEILDEVKEKGNLTVHEVIRVIPKSYANKIQDEIDLALESLLISYNKLENEKIIIEPERLEIIYNKLGLNGKTKSSKKKKGVPISKIEDTLELKKYEFLKRYIFLLQKYEDIRDNEREEIETSRELCELSKKLNLIKFTVNKKKPPAGFFDVFPAMMTIYDNNFEFVFELIDLPNKFKITARSESSSYFSEEYLKEIKPGNQAIDNGIDAGDLIPEWKTHKIEVLNDFIEYLISRMEDLRLYKLIEDIKATEKILKKYLRIQKFIEYLFSEDHLNQDSNEVRNDERVISELNWIKQNEKEINDYYTIFRRKDEPGKYAKVLSLLNGEYLVQFRDHAPFKSTIKTNGTIIESSAMKKVNSILYKIFEGIKNHIKDNYNIRL